MAIQIAPEVDALRRDIQEKYTEVATSPELEFHFHHGRPLAKILEYSDDLLEGLPEAAVESFAGVGNPFSVGKIAPGETVLDIGSGSGFDCFIAAKMVGPTGKVIGVDMTDAMLENRGRLLTRWASPSWNSRRASPKNCLHRTARWT